ncbi:MAG: AAA family ATPase [Pseudolysinimonas sp.]
MPVVLVTGMSGTGTTSVLDELATRGYRTVDTDYDGWQVPSADGSELVFDAERMRALFAEPGTAPVFLAGCVSNQGEFPFDAVVLLAAPEAVILRRVEERTNNSYGSTPEDRAEISRNLRDVEPLLRRTCDIELDATRSISDLADDVEAMGLRDASGEAGRSSGS